MSYILIGSPDKISLNSFIKHIRRYFPEHKVGDMHSLMSEDSMTLYVTDFCNKFPKGIFSYYAKRMVNRDPMSCLPKEAVKMAGSVVWFNLFSTDPTVLKDPDGSLNVAIEAWKQYIQKIS
jgi:hypothetical protein